MSKGYKIRENGYICYFCSRDVDNDRYCYGCRHYVCVECDETQPIGLHQIKDHKRKEVEL
ncbi:unnamed protein product [marine sediment metagenome]|uniref:B box-type domain-containing protein n=1 Tax=marine sediment metagenome TaxID=412755 RepID=X1I7Y0_9ZZZZ